jgi:putative hydrolase of the HAD superfamily
LDFTLRNERILIFDVFGTLLDFEEDQHRLEAYGFLSEWLGYHGIFAEMKEIRSRFFELSRQAMLLVPHQHPDIRVEDVFEKLLFSFERAEDAYPREILEQAILLFRTLTTKSISVYPEIPGTIRGLDGKVRMAVASNTQRLYTIAELRRFKLLEFFETIVFSSDVHACKPNPLIFESVLEKMEVSGEQAIYIGDNPFDDVLGASNVGMQTVLLERPRTFSQSVGMPIPVPSRVVKAEELPDLTEILLEMITAG